jgi:hypothetical protein|tara:strand:+ start:886 stop:1395 length:510 start_codon:yes stop_codon:yes gene_type:complete
MNNVVIKSRIPKRIIKDDFLDFDYKKQPLTNSSELDNWRSQGYTHDSFLGSMYNSTNPMPKWVDQIPDALGMTKCGFVFYRMDQLDIMPPHVDHFDTYCRVFEVERELVYRAIVFLEDWKPGHYFEYDSRGTVNWKQGDYVIYSTDTPHAASNIGTSPRYTLQVTGILK